ncbi:MAG: hypothetical protein KAS32_23515 [Candidatus Peribacteraceae bacterium]|nr:hypothetical protein [Candidatus Peribacteraceae bacterium]
MTPYEIITELASLSGSKAKLAILKEHEDNDLLSRVIQLAYDTTINYYITAPVLAYDTSSLTRGTNTLSTVLSLLEYDIATRKVTGNAAKNLLQNAVNGLNLEDAQVIKWILLRDIRAGVGPKTILKVWPDLFFIYPYMRCSTGNKKNLESITFPAYSEKKADGMFANIFVGENNNVSMTSRNGTLLANIPYAIENDFQKLAGQFIPDSTVFNGEIVVEHDGQILPREIGNGICNSVMINHEPWPDGYNSILYIWDIIPYEDFMKGKWDVTRKERLEYLEDIFDSTYTESVHMIPWKLVHNLDDIMVSFQEMISAGHEGCVVKDAKGIWKDGTSKHQIKMKIEKIVELRLVGFNPGEGKNEATFGSMICESEDGKLSVGVSGLKDVARQEIWDNREQYIGKVLSIKSNGVTLPTPNNEQHSLYLPRFVEFRDNEKSEADNLNYIMEAFKTL